MSKTVGGMLLIAGSCIGAGMLGLPIITGFAGFFPSLIAFVVAWLLMTTTGLMLVEVNGSFSDRVNFSTMTRATLGLVGKWLTLLLYLFLFYALLVAYIALSGHQMSSLVGQHLPSWLGSLFFVCLFAVFVFHGTRSVDFLNRILMFGKILAFIGVVVVGFMYIHPNRIEYANARYVIFPIPVLIVSFGFHNMIPSLMDYLDGDVKEVRKAIIGGSLMVLVVYLLWEIIALGILPMYGRSGIMVGYEEGIDAAQQIRNVMAHSTWMNSCTLVLAFFAILTSFLAQSLSLVHFLGDGLSIRKWGPYENPILCFLALAPPLILAMLFPHIFFKALDFAGGICAITLFGLFPSLMVWRHRYVMRSESRYTLAGGKAPLVAIGIFSVFVLLYQLTQTFDLNVFPTP